MRYFKKQDEQIIEYSGVALGGEQWYINLGWLPYDTTLPLSRLDIIDGEIIELPEPDPAPQTISKLKLMRNLSDLGLWESFKAGLVEAGLYEEFEIAVNITTDDEGFATALIMFETLLQDSDTTTTELIASSLWEG